MKHLRFLNAFLESEKSGGLVLLFCTIGSIFISNSLLGGSYQHFWHNPVLTKPIEFWINDGLMTIFFVQVGLEIEREIYIGELNDFKKALLPIIAAIGGISTEPILIRSLVRYISIACGLVNNNF